MVERGLSLSAIIEQIGKVDPGLAVGGVDLEGSAKPIERAGIVAESVRRVAEAGGGVGGLGGGSRSQIEEPVRRRDEPFAEQCPADLEHQLMIVLEAELQDPLAGPHRARAVA